MRPAIICAARCTRYPLTNFRRAQSAETRTQMDNPQIARVAHEANRAYCIGLDDHSQVSWDLAPDWQKQSAINGVQFHRENPDAGPSHSHESWLAEKERDGWKYGPMKDAEKREHPCFVPYDELPPEQKLKDSLFIAVVRALT